MVILFTILQITINVNPIWHFSPNYDKLKAVWLLFSFYADNNM